MRLIRFIWFGVAILGGLILGLLYGWLINPVKFVNTPPSSLRADYRADYVLMVAEIYAADGDLVQAAKSLQMLDASASPLGTVQFTFLIAQNLGYSRQDLQTISDLSQALQVLTPVPAGGTP